MVKEIDSARGIGGEMVVLLSHRLSKTLMDPTSLLSREPLQSPLPLPPPPYPAPQGSPQPRRVTPRRTLTRPTRGKTRENGTQPERWGTGGVVTADHSHSHPQGITAMSQTAIQTNWRLTCCLWMARLWTQTTHLWRIHLLLPCLQNHLSPAPKLRVL